MRGRGTGIAVGVLLALGTVFGPPGTGVAGAQPGEATIVVEQAQPLLAAYDYTVRVVDAVGAPVNGAAVSGTPVGPDGFVGRITTLEPLDQDGRYRGIVEMPAPGSWTVRFAVADPVANLEHVQEMAVPGAAVPGETPVTEPPLAEEPPPADAGPEGADAGAAQPAGDAPGAAPTGAPADEDESSGGSKAVPIVLALAAAVVVVAFGTAVVVLRRRREAAEALDAVQKEDPLQAIDPDDIDADPDADATLVVDDSDDDTETEVEVGVAEDESATTGS